MTVFRVDAADATLFWAGAPAPLVCALGRGGTVRNKHEGDGATPVGRWRLRWVYYRPDREAAPRTALPVRAIDPGDGWCDAPADPLYNRPVRLPYPASCEVLRRADGLYDLIVVLGYNDAPVVPGAGSAIFLHVARERFEPTAGCVALAATDLRRLIAAAKPGDVLEISG